MSNDCSIRRDEEWLVKQYRGEVTASDRIAALTEKYAPGDKERVILTVISDQERQHAEWVLGLLKTRGIVPSLDGAEDRWSATLSGVDSFPTAAAVEAHVEALRLERIRAIVADEEAPEDVRSVFQRILKDKVFHERAFRSMAGPEAMAKMQGAHDKGMELLGLTV